MPTELALTPEATELDACTSVEQLEYDCVRVSSIWGDVCFVSSWHLVHEKRLYFWRKHRSACILAPSPE
jgi:hypothetical protein